MTSRKLRSTGRIALQLSLCGAVLTATCVSVLTLRPARAERATEIQCSSPLPAQFLAIRPADLDGTPPPIPPAELWPAQ